MKLFGKELTALIIKVTLFLLFLCTIFPPFIDQYTGIVRAREWGFIFSPPEGVKIDILTLFVEYVLIMFLMCFIHFVEIKVRWNWRKIIIRSSVIIFIFAIIIFIGVIISLYYNSKSNLASVATKQPSIQNLFWGISLNTKKSDIKFLKGEPYKIEGEHWLYENGYEIIFSGDKIRAIYYLCGATEFVYELGLQVRPGNIAFSGLGNPDFLLNEVANKLGKPSYVSESHDQLSRIYNYDNYHSFLLLGQDELKGCGIFNPKYGPLKFSDLTFMKYKCPTFQGKFDNFKNLQK